MTNPERSVDEIVEEFIKEFEAERDFTSDPQFTVQIRDINDYTDWLTQTLQAERQKREEMVERIEKKLVALSWQEENETPEAINIIHEIREAITKPNNPKV